MVSPKYLEKIFLKSFGEWRRSVARLREKFLQAGGGGRLGKWCLDHAASPFLFSCHFLWTSLLLSHIVPFLHPSLSFPAIVLLSSYTHPPKTVYREDRLGPSRSPYFEGLSRGPYTMVWLLPVDYFCKISPFNFCMSYFPCFFTFNFTFWT